MFKTLRRNSHRNDATFDLNLRARKSLVIGRRTAAVFIEIFNVLNSDDLRIFTYKPVAPDLESFDASDLTQGPLQLDANRRFGRRFQVGFQIDF